MRWVRFTAEGETRYGLLEGERIRRVKGDPFHGHEAEDAWFERKDVRIEIPVVPVTFYAAGLNYAQHVTEQARSRGEEPKLPPQADIGYRANNALIADGDAVVIPPDAKQVEYEGEIVAVIGERARNLTEANALDCVLGYTLGNDVSERIWQRNDRTFWRAKNSDTFKPMGPYIDTDFDPAGATTTVRVNGVVSSQFPTAGMIYDLRTFLVRMTRYLTLVPGDVVWMGTDGHSPALKAGDVVEVEISGLGVLRNPFVQGK
jgi:2-keto-4-pentenoate hydratase/2-oxohepta-3-ene-1,7-dioic acid hydratase in catechol pathway